MQAIRDDGSMLSNVGTLARYGASQLGVPYRAKLLRSCCGGVTIKRLSQRFVLRFRSIGQHLVEFCCFLQIGHASHQ